MNNLSQAQTLTESILQTLPNDDNLSSILGTSFGDDYNSLLANEIFTQWQAGNFSNLPSLLVLPTTDMFGAIGAYSSDTNQVYLSESFVNTATIDEIKDVLVEEYGHYFDAEINIIDALGDEGKIFSILAQGNNISPELLSSLKAEDDSGYVFVAGQLVAVENATITLNVDTTADQNDGSNSGGLSLRDAILISNTDPNNDYIINLQAGQTYSLTRDGINEDAGFTGDLDVQGQITIQGNGSTIDAGSLANRDRAFHVLDGSRLTLNNITVTRGFTTGNGGGISVADDANLNLFNSTIIDNTARFGGGIYEGTNTITNSSITNNTADNQGGGIYKGTNIITNSTINGNSAGISGGGINEGTNTIINSTISNNSARFGGGIGRGINTITNSTISDNSADNSGGGINDGTNTITNSTISGNSAEVDGGGINEGTSTISNSTITNNIANSDNDGIGDGGGIFIERSASANILNTIVAGNFDLPDRNGGGDIHADISGSVEGNNFNLIGSLTGASGSVGTGSDIINPNVRLAPLGDYGGATQTHALYEGSPALNAGNNALIPEDTEDLDGDGNTQEPISFDQRGDGFDRILDGTVDIGSFEGSIPDPIGLLDTVLNRFQNSALPGTFLFANEGESETIRRDFPNFIEEGPAFKVADAPSDNLLQFNRFQNSNVPGTYLYATEGESQSIRANFPNFIEEGIAFYAFGADADIGVDYYRMQNTAQPGTYIFVGEAEKNQIEANFPQFVNEGIAFEVAEF